jgi:hypothetical protein
MGFAAFAAYVVGWCLFFLQLVGVVDRVVLCVVALSESSCSSLIFAGVIVTF